MATSQKGELFRRGGDNAMTLDTWYDLKFASSSLSGSAPSRADENGKRRRRRSKHPSARERESR